MIGEDTLTGVVAPSATQSTVVGRLPESAISCGFFKGPRMSFLDFGILVRSNFSGTGLPLSLRPSKTLNSF